MTSSKNILFVTKELVPYYYGGIGTLFKAQARLLLRKGHRVSFLSRQPENSSPETLRKHYGNVDFHYIDVHDEASFVDYSPSGGVISPYSLAYAVGVEKKYREIARESPPDIVICADYGGEGFFLFLKSCLLNIYRQTRFILHISGGLHEVLAAYDGDDGERSGEINELKNIVDCSIEDSCISLAPEIIAPTVAAWSLVKERLGIDRPVAIVANTIDRNQFSTEVTVPETGDGKYLLFVGRLDRVKGADLLLQLFLNHHESLGEGVKLVMVGRDCFWKEYKCTFLEYWQNRIPENVRGKILFTGQVEHGQVQEYFSRAALCIFPSRLEIFGNVCLEAMSFGVPCIVAANTGLAEILGNNLCQYVVDFGKGNSEIAKAISSVINMENKQRKHLGGTFRKRFDSVLESADRDFLDVIERGSEADGKYSKLAKDEVYNKVFSAIAALTEITFFLGNDVQQLKRYYNPDDDTYLKIVRGEITNPKPQKTLSLYQKALKTLRTK